MTQDDPRQDEKNLREKLLSRDALQKALWFIFEHWVKAAVHGVFMLERGVGFLKKSVLDLQDKVRKDQEGR